MIKPQVKDVPSLSYKHKNMIKERRQEQGIRRTESLEIKWRRINFKERFLITASIRKNNLRCISRYVAYSLVPAALLTLGAFFIHFIVSVVVGGLYASSILVYFFSLERMCIRVWSGKAKCSDAACFMRDEEYQYTINGFSYFLNVFRLSSANDRRLYKLPVYRSTFMYSNAGDNMLVVRFSKNNIRCFSKKELGLTSHKSKNGSWSRLSRPEIDYVVKKEKVKLKEAKIIFGVDFTFMSIFAIFILTNFIYFFPYAIGLLFFMVVIDALRIRKFTSRIRRLRKTRVNALKNAIVSCFMIRKPSGRGGYNYVHYMKIMHPETGKFRLEKLKQYTWVTPFDNEVSDNIIVVDYGRRRKGRNMQHYMLEEYYNEGHQGSDI